MCLLLVCISEQVSVLVYSIPLESTWKIIIHWESIWVWRVQYRRFHSPFRRLLHKFILTCIVLKAVIFTRSLFAIDFYMKVWTGRKVMGHALFTKLQSIPCIFGISLYRTLGPLFNTFLFHAGISVPLIYLYRSVGFTWRFAC